MAVIASNRVLSGITFAQSTAENRAVAASQTGGTVTSLTNIITPVSLETGRIYYETVSNVVTGIGTEFLTDFQPEQYLFAYDRITAAPALIGKIQAIGSDNSLTLTENAPATVVSTAAVYCGKTNILLSTRDSIIMRVPVPVASGFFFLPYWANWRIGGGSIDTGFNRQDRSSLERISSVGSPETPAGTPYQSIKYTINPLVSGWVKFTEADRSGNNLTNIVKYFPLGQQNTIPVFAYAELNPFGDTVQNLTPNTLFKLFASQEFQENTIQATNGYLQTDLRAAGYPV
jgi:hypothetical protein